MEKPMISVILPMYNSTSQTKKCIDSILNQEYKDFEIVIVDDCSKNGCYEHYKSIYSGVDNIHWYRLDKNGGTGMARNFGMDMARGKYITFIDHDDTYLPDALKKMIMIALKYSADVVSSVGFYRVIESKGEKRHYFMDKNPVEVDTVLTDDFKTRMERWENDEIRWTVWNKLFLKEFLDKHNIRFEKIPIIDDVLFHFQTLCYSIVYVQTPELFNMHYIHENNQSESTKGERSDIKYLKVMMSILLDKQKFIDQYMDKINFFSKYPEYRERIKRHLDENNMNFLARQSGKLYRNMKINEEVNENIIKILSPVFHEHSWWVANIFHQLNICRERLSRNNSLTRNVSNEERCFFPFYLFSGKEKVVIYGEGKFIKLLCDESKGTNYLELVGAIDENDMQGEEKLKKMECDYILLATEKKSKILKNRLINWGFHEDMIKWDVPVYDRKSFYNKYYLPFLGHPFA